MRRTDVGTWSVPLIFLGLAPGPKSPRFRQRVTSGPVRWGGRSLERSHRGLVRSIGNAVYLHRYRGFESPSLRKQSLLCHEPSLLGRAMFQGASRREAPGISCSPGAGGVPFESVESSGVGHGGSSSMSGFESPRRDCAIPCVHGTRCSRQGFRAETQQSIVGRPGSWTQAWRAD